MAFKMNGWSAFKQPKENVETFSINPNDAQLKILKINLVQTTIQI